MPDRRAPRTRPRQATGLVALVLGVVALAACESAEGGIPEDDPSLNVINASFETFAGEDRRFAFALTDLENAPITGADVEVYLREVEEPDEVSGPHEAAFHTAEDTGTPTGVYVAHLDRHEPGHVELVVVEDDEWGSAAVNVVDAETSQAPAPGEPAIPVETPTFDDDLGVEQISTLSEPTTMHEMSLDEVLEQGRPAMVMFATPAYCQTAVCGPAVENLEEIHTSRDWGDVVFLHLEIFTDEADTLAPWVEAWELPSEPWLYAIDEDGTIVDRMDGPMVPAEMEAMAESLLDSDEA